MSHENCSHGECHAKCCGHGGCGHEHCHCHSCAHHECCHHHHEQEDFAKQLIEMADEAWMEVLMDKIKEQVIIHSGAHLDQLAKLVAETNNARWKEKLALQKRGNDFKDKVDQFFNK